VAEASAVSDVVQLLACPNTEVQRLAAGVLHNLSDADIKAVQRACARAGAATALLQLLGSRGTSSAAQEDAAIALRQLASHHAAHRRAIMAHPGSISTQQRIMLDASASVRTVEEALGVLRHLTFDDHVTSIIPAVPTVVRCLRSPNADLAALAALLLGDLARYSADARQAILSAGGIPTLGAALHSLKGMTATAMAAVATLALASLGNRQAAAAAVRAQGIGPGDPREQESIEVLASGPSPEELYLLADLPLPGLAPAGFPAQASGYRCGGRELGMAGATISGGQSSMPADVCETRGSQARLLAEVPALGSQQAASYPT